MAENVPPHISDALIRESVENDGHEDTLQSVLSKLSTLSDAEKLQVATRLIETFSSSKNLSETPSSELRTEFNETTAKAREETASREIFTLVAELAPDMVHLMPSTQNFDVLTEWLLLHARDPYILDLVHEKRRALNRE